MHNCEVGYGIIWYMIRKIQELIEENRMEEAMETIGEAIQKDGFNDTYAIFLATINSYYGDEIGYESMIEKGLEFNHKNFELHLMKANLLEGQGKLEAAFREYDFALAHCRQVSFGSEDYSFVENSYKVFYDRNRDFLESYIDSCPILVYKSEDICYGLLNHFADEIVKELQKQGEAVEVIDVTEVPIEEVARLEGNRYKAILGIQSYLFSVNFKDGRNIHNYIFGPKFNMLFDHPACMYQHFTKGPWEYYILTHDRNYLGFIKKHYPDIIDTFILPPAGERAKKDKYEKEYNLSFVGSYKSPDTWDGVLSELDKLHKGAAKRLEGELMRHPNDTYESCFEKVFGKNADIATYFDMKATYFKVMSYYRQLILDKILESKIELHVFGDSWKNERWEKYPNLIIHDTVDFYESLEVYAKSVMSLNLMSWHKDGRTERIANIMLNNCLAVTDKTQFLEENHSDKMLLLDLDNIDEIPDKIKNLQGDLEKMQTMCKSSYEVALATETWECRIRDFKNIMEIVNKKL